MKILGQINIEKPDENSRKTTAKTVNLTQYRKKRKRTRNLIKFILILILVIIFAYIWINADRIFEPLRGIASKIETKTSNEIGFPITLPGSAGYSFEKFGDNFSLLTDTYLYTYETTGAQVYALRHGYSNPAQITTDRRILLYDKAAYSFAVYNKTSLIYQKTVDDKIVFGAISENDYTAIVTNSPRYSNVLYVYDGGGNWKYTHKFADENVMQVCFSDESHIVVSTISVDNGEIVTNFYRFSIKSGDGYEWKYSFKGNSLPCGMYADSNVAISVCDNRALIINSDDGSFMGEYEFNGILRDFEISRNLTAIYYNDVSTNHNIIVTLNGNLELMNTYSVTYALQRLAIDNDTLYALDGSHIKTFSEEPGGGQSSYTLTEDYTDFIKIGNHAFLLSYDVVARERIE